MFLLQFVKNVVVNLWGFLGIFNGVSKVHI